ncbi:MAG: hypothetical protein GEV06_07110 [Luteitalea sp.]|nr:hypothetical protein [Luteitalea sp.]
MKQLTTLVVATAMLCTGSTVAWADNTTSDNADFLFMGQVRSTTLSPEIKKRWFKARFVEGRSYYLYAWAPYTDPSESSVNLQGSGFADDGFSLGPNTLLSEPHLFLHGHRGAQKVYLPGGSGTVRLSVDWFQQTPTATFTVHVLLVETTLFSPWWYTSVDDGYEGFVEIKNNTDIQRRVYLTAYSGDGTVVGQTSTVILANGNTVVGLKAHFTLTGDQSGSVQLAHDGAQGAISANITTLSATTGLSFDSPFTTRQSPL